MKSYDGVPCSRCGEPIAVSEKIVRIRDEIAQRETYAPHAFVVRCKLCHYESVYPIRRIETFTGEPRKS